MNFSLNKLFFSCKHFSLTLMHYKTKGVGLNGPQFMKPQGTKLIQHTNDQHNV